MTTDDYVEVIHSVFTAFAAATGLTMIADGIDNHGGLEWQAGKAGELNRYLTVGLIPDKSWAPAAFEVRVGAEDGRRFTNRILLDWTPGPARLQGGNGHVERLPPDGADVSSLAAGMSFRALLGTLPEMLEKAWITAESLELADLDNEFVIPRRGPGDESEIIRQRR